MLENANTHPHDAPHLARLREIAHTHRMLFIAGLPGVGKSLLLRELAESAHADGRAVYLLQWDVARCPICSPTLLARYPETNGITHAVLRKAAGLWARDAVAAWAAEHADDGALLAGETPLVGHRFVELARPAADAAEPALSSGSTRFLVPVPTVEVRRAIEAARAATTERPRHEREQNDAIPGVLRILWAELFVAAAQVAAERGDPPPVDIGYDPETYKAVYSRALRVRHWEPLRVETALPPQDRSVYDVQAPAQDLAPSEAEAEAYVARVEREYPDLAVLQRETETWWRA
ncbi:MAG: hypothetical protein OXC99_05815 [Chloroflexi bacterium]|nr:hypothetical protein [Chloroflexota bacterium]